MNRYDYYKYSKQPKVAVLIHCYNHRNYLSQCIESIRSQTYENWHIYFWDCNSEDDSYNLAQMELSNISDKATLYTTKILADKTLPIGINRWIGLNWILENTDFDLVTILDADDYWHKEKLKKQVKAYNETGAKMVYTDCEILRSKEEVKQIEYYPAFVIDIIDKKRKRSYNQIYKNYEEDVHWNLLTKRNFIACPTLMLECKALKKVIGKPTHYTSAEDYDLVLKMSAKYDVEYVPEVLASYRIHEDQVTKKTPARNSAEEIDCIKSNSRLRNWTQWQRMKIYVHLLWVYFKLLAKEFIEAEDYIRNENKKEV